MDPKLLKDQYVRFNSIQYYQEGILQTILMLISVSHPMNDGQFAVIQTHSLIFLSSDLGVIVLSWPPRWDLIPADYIPGIPSQRGLHSTEAKKPFRPVC